MANWDVLKSAIAGIIKTNNNQEITGQLLQNVLNNIASSVGENATFAGIATFTTNPGTPDGPVFYLATEAGVYANFNGITILEGEAVILQWNSGVWAKKTTGFATQESVKKLFTNIGLIHNGTYTFSSSQNIEISDVVLEKRFVVSIASDKTFSFHVAYYNGTSYPVLASGKSNSGPVSFIMPSESINKKLYITPTVNETTTFEVTVLTEPISHTANLPLLEAEMLKLQNDIYGDYSVYDYQFAGESNNTLDILVNAGDKFLISASSDTEFSLNVFVEEELYSYKLVGVLKKDGALAIHIDKDYLDRITFNNTDGSANFRVSLSVTRVADSYIAQRIFDIWSQLNALETVVKNTDGQIKNLFIKDYQRLTDKEKSLALCLESVCLQVDETLVGSELYLRVFGLYNDTFYMQVWDRNANAVVIDIAKPADSLNGEKVLIAKKSGHAKIEAVVDSAKIIEADFINDIDSRIVLVANGIFPNGYFQELPQVKTNLIILDECTNNTYMTEFGVITPLDEWLMSNYMEVKPHTMYKSSIGIPFINFFNAKKQRTRGLIQYDRPEIFTTEADEVFAIASYSPWDETLTIQEVNNENEKVDLFIAPINSKAYISDGAYSAAKFTGKYLGDFNVGQKSKLTNQVLLSAEKKLIATSIVGSYRGFITRLKFNCDCAAPFPMTFGVGNIDQRNWGLLSREFTVEVVNGYNDIPVRVKIEEDERLFIIADMSSSAVSAKLYSGDTGIHYESQDREIEMSRKTGGLSVEYTISGERVISDSPLVNTSQLNSAISNVNSAISEISLDKLHLNSPNGSYYKLTVSNDGQLGVLEIPTQGTFLIMGNSYDVHEYSEGLWWGDFGMAASRKENDWKHQLLSKLRKNDDLIYNFQKQSLTGWETTWNKADNTVEDIFVYSDENLPALTANSNYSMVIIRVGENNTDTNYERVKLRVKNLLSYIQSKVGTSVPILLGACVKIRTEQNAVFESAAAEFSNVTYVDMTPAGRLDTFAAGLDYRVLGDDGIWHTISESSQASAVAGHPNDAVFAKMADLFYPVVLNKL